MSNKDKDKHYFALATYSELHKSWKVLKTFRTFTEAEYARCGKYLMGDEVKTIHIYGGTKYGKIN